MTIVILGGNYYLKNGTKLTDAEAYQLYELGLVDHEEHLSYE